MNPVFYYRWSYDFNYLLFHLIWKGIVAIPLKGEGIAASSGVNKIILIIINNTIIYNGKGNITPYPNDTHKKITSTTNLNKFIYFVLMRVWYTWNEHIPVTCTLDSVIKVVQMDPLYFTGCWARWTDQFLPWVLTSRRDSFSFVRQSLLASDRFVNI